MEKSKLLAGRAALITGAGQGLGLAIAQEFAVHGAGVLIADIDEDRAREAAVNLHERGFEAQFTRCDVGSEDDVNRAVGECADRFGTIDIMVNNAGITRDATMRTMTVDQFDAVIGTHLRGTWLGVRAAGCGDARAARWIHHQHVIDLRQSRIGGADQLQCGEGWDRGPHQGCSERTCPPRCSSECNCPRIDSYADDRGHA